MTPSAGLTITMCNRTVPKPDRTPEENEDSVAGDVLTGRFAIADGASTSARPEVWSDLLTSTFVSGADPLAPEVLGELRAAWWRAVFRPGLSWYATEKLMQGGAATFVGLQIIGDSYQASAVGDSCLFHLRDDELLLAGPLQDAAEFSRFPALVRTNVESPALDADQWTCSGTLRDGDVLVMATDALACQLLRAHGTTGAFPPLREQTRSDAEFAAFVNTERARGMANDDTTVCVVTI